MSAIRLRHHLSHVGRNVSPQDKEKTAAREISFSMEAKENMNKWPLFLLLICLTSTGNPTYNVLDVGLAKENVEIVCDKNSGYVNGKFTFTFLGSAEVGGKIHPPPGYSNKIYLPVYLPKDSMNKRIWEDSAVFTASYQDKIISNKSAFEEHDVSYLPKTNTLDPFWASLDFEPVTKLIDLERRRIFPNLQKELETASTEELRQKAWKKIYHVDDSLGRNQGVEINISYRQKTYVDGGKVLFIYVPLIPHMSKPDNYSITIKCKTNFRIDLISKNTVMKKEPDLITINPKHLESIIVSITGK
jgi:hypothetical protein